MDNNSNITRINNIIGFGGMNLSAFSDVSPELDALEPDRHHSSRAAPLKRSRVQLSCKSCRSGKLKCDRQLPCHQCVKRGKASQCIFPAAAPRKEAPVSLQKRLQHLENLVKDVMTSHTSKLIGDGNGHLSISPESDQDSQPLSTGPSSSKNESSESPPEDLPVASGSVLENTKETAYIGASHWLAVLDDIEEVRNYLCAGDDDAPSPEDESGPDLIFQSPSRLTAEELIAALPPRAIVDKHISRYFQSPFPSKHILHKPTFLKEYKQFWENPAAAPLAWLSLLYGLMAHATFAALSKGEDNPDKRGNHIQTITAYKKWCTQCLVLSNYTQAGPHTIEAMLVYMESEFANGNQVSCYLLVAVVLRLALRIGLHRDSTKIAGNISVFRGEMRRRMWHFLYQIDLLASFHIGLPAMVQGIESDTAYPRNYNDDDIYESCTELPPSRPESEMTSMSYMICKNRVMAVFGQIAAQANRLTLPPYEDVLKLDEALNQAFDKVPTFFRVVPLELAFTVSAELIVQRFSIAILYFKSRCVLHRKYMLDDQKYTFSKQASLDASLQLLRFQSSIHDAVKPDGLLSGESWFVSSLSMHDFLLAATIIYLILIQAINVAEDNQLLHVLEQHQESITLLERSYAVWNETKMMVREASKASDILGMMVSRVNLAIQAKRISSQEIIPDIDPISQLSITDQATFPGLSSAYHNNTADYSMKLSEATMSPALPLQFDPSMPLVGDPIESMLDTPMYFNWDTFDNHLRPQQPTDQIWNDFSNPNFGLADENDYYTL